MTAHTKPPRIVLVERVPSVLDALRWALDETPDVVIVGEALTGEDALILAEQLQPDLMIVDVGLGPQDGFTLTRAIKALHQPPAVLLLAAHDEPSVIRRAQAAGCDAIAAKDSDLNALISAIWRGLAHRSQTAAASRSETPGA